jgi:hypothetical protein
LIKHLSNLHHLK